MELKEAIETRRSIRREYQNKKIPHETLEDILHCGILSPSAKNREPWHFIVIENADIKNNIAELLERKLPEAALTSEVIKTCSALIMVYGDIENTILDVESIGASIENMILRATDLNIASLWIGYTLKIEEEINKLLNTNKTLIATLALGYSDIKPKPRPRKKLEEVTKWL